MKLLAKVLKFVACATFDVRSTEVSAALATSECVLIVFNIIFSSVKDVFNVYENVKRFKPNVAWTAFITLPIFTAIAPPMIWDTAAIRDA